MLCKRRVLINTINMNLPDVQMQIISKLKNAGSLRYRDIKLTDISSDLYNYHLKALVQRQLIDKTTQGYSLSKTGQAYVADVYHSSDAQLQRLFKVNVITIVSRLGSSGGIEILTQRRNSQPSHGMVDVMGGTIVKGEDAVAGACRKLHDETGLTAEFRILGIERRRLYKDSELFSDVIFPICYADNYNGELTSTEFGENFWTPIEQAITNASRPFDSIASIVTCLEAIRDGKLGALTMFYKESTQTDSL